MDRTILLVELQQKTTVDDISPGQFTGRVYTLVHQSHTRLCHSTSSQHVHDNTLYTMSLITLYKVLKTQLY